MTTGRTFCGEPLLFCGKPYGHDGSCDTDPASPEAARPGDGATGSEGSFRSPAQPEPPGEWQSIGLGGIPTEATMAEATFEGWAILELMGHRKLAGYVREQEVAGAGFLRIDVPNPKAGQPTTATQFYAPGAIYCLTPTTEDIARRMAAGLQPEPATRWELPPARSDRDAEDADTVAEVEAF